MGILFLQILQGCATISREKYLQNQQIKIAVFSLQNDLYGATDEVIAKYHKEGYRIVERAELYRVFDEMQLQMSGITEYEAVKCGKILNVDYIILGSAYTNYIPPPSEPKSYGTTAWSGAAVGFAYGLGLGLSGTWCYANIRWIKVETGEVIKTDTIRVGKR